MGSDMVVALGPATVTQSTLFGLNSHRSKGEVPTIRVIPGTEHAPDEYISFHGMKVPQARKTFTCLGCRPENHWGFYYGVNEHRVAAGFSDWNSALQSSKEGLEGTDFVRLILERSQSARQGVELLSGTISRYSQLDDHIFLIADSKEAFVMEAAGRYWAIQEIGRVRAVSDIGVIRQDWNRLSPGLADLAINNGWFPDDGQKLDFMGSIGADLVGECSALRRWGRSTFHLENQNGSIDLNFLRRVLGDHYEETRFEANPSHGASYPIPICRHASPEDVDVTTSSFVVDLDPRHKNFLLVWQAFGPPCTSLYFPLFVVGNEMPRGSSTKALGLTLKETWETSHNLQNVISGDANRWNSIQEEISILQMEFDKDAAEFSVEASELTGQNTREHLRQRGDEMLQTHLEKFAKLTRQFLGTKTAESHPELVMN